MPRQGIIITPLEFAEDEWAKLTRGWAGLSPPEKERRIAEKVAELRAAGRLDYLPSLPQWDEIVKLGPLGPKQTADELRARRRGIAIRIRNSPTPPEVRALGTIVNAIDDAEDLLSFVALVGRLILRVAPRLVTRFLPGLGVLITASDVLNLLTFLTQAMAIGAGFKHAGLTGAAATAAGPIAVKAILKHELWEILRLGTRKRIPKGALGDPIRRIYQRTRLPTFHKLTKAEILAGRDVNLGDLLEAGQATGTLVGTGISLGGLMGYIQDTAWGFHDAVFGRVPQGAVVLGKELADELPAEDLVYLEGIPNKTRL